MSEERGELLDDFRDLSGWSAVASGQARLRISPDEGPHGPAMRLDFDFAGGGGFVVARKVFARSLPTSWAFRCFVRGAAPANKFEFKLALDYGNGKTRQQIAGRTVVMELQKFCKQQVRC